MISQQLWSALGLHKTMFVNSQSQPREKLVGEWEAEKILGECVLFVIVVAVSVVSMLQTHGIGKAFSA